MSQHVIFVAPFFMDATLRFLGGATRLPNVDLTLISQDPLEKLQGFWVLLLRCAQQTEQPLGFGVVRLEAVGFCQVGLGLFQAALLGV